MIQSLKKHPIYLFLLPVFFVLHGYFENFGFINANDAAVLCFNYLLMTFSIAVLAYFFFRRWTKAALITTAWMIFFFFFGALHEFLKAHLPVQFFSRFGFLLGVFCLLYIWFFIYLRKAKKPFFRLSLFLNVLFLVYLILEMGTGIQKIMQPPHHGLSVYSFAKQPRVKECDSCSKPDIYFLLFDEYGSSIALREQYEFQNNLDTFLSEKGFQIQKGSYSNYNFTPFSMASTLNMSYIEGIKNARAVTIDDYSNCNLLIRNNEVIRILDAQGYEIVNYSIFDLAGHPFMIKQSFLP